MQFHAAEFRRGFAVVPEHLEEISQSGKERIDPAQLSCCQYDSAHHVLDGGGIATRVRDQQVQHPKLRQLLMQSPAQLPGALSNAVERMGDGGSDGPPGDSDQV